MSAHSPWGSAAALGPLLIASWVHAQPAPLARTPDPLDAKTAVPAAGHRSVLSGYSAKREGPSVSWKEVNETVTRIGGWRTYAREAAEPAAAASTPEPSSPRPPAAPARSPAPHAGHGAHGKP